MLGCFVQEARARAERWPGQTQLQDVKPSPGVPGSTVLMGTRPPCPASERELKGSRTKSSPHHPIRPLASPGTSHLPLIPIPAQLPDPSRRSRRSPDCHRQEQREEKGKGHGACRVGRLGPLRLFSGTHRRRLHPHSTTVEATTNHWSAGYTSSTEQNPVPGTGQAGPPLLQLVSSKACMSWTSHILWFHTEQNRNS